MSSWNRSIPVFHLLLVVLLAGNLGSHVFVAANALDCSSGYVRGDNSWSCYVQGRNADGSDRSTYECSKCGRADGHVPAAKDCINDDTNQLVNNGGAWNCDILMDLDQNRIGGRAITCNHAEPGGSVGLYYCRLHFRNMQCPLNACKLIWNIDFIPVLSDSPYIPMWLLRVHDGVSWVRCCYEMWLWFLTSWTLTLHIAPPLRKIKFYPNILNQAKFGSIWCGNYLCKSGFLISCPLIGVCMY